VPRRSSQLCCPRQAPLRAQPSRSPAESWQFSSRSPAHRPATAGLPGPRATAP